MKTNTLLAIIISLLVGGGIGYAMNDQAESVPASTSMDHDMMGHSMMNHSMMTTEGHDMETIMMDMTARMKAKTGDELDRIFLEDMIVHHQGAVDMAVIIRDNTERPELKAFAQEIIDVQDKEISMMRGWLDEWFN